MRAVGAIDATRMADLQEYVRGQHITEALFRDADRHGYAIRDVFWMDEYTIDIVVEPPGGPWLVYDTT